MLEKLLKEAGFSEKEREVYAALLTVGSAIVSDIAKKAGINRSTTYVILGSLSKRGLVNITERRGVKVYNSMPPEQLIKHLESMAKQYTDLAGSAKELLPKLKAEYKSSEAANPTTSKVRLFEGTEGMKTVYEDALSSLETIRSYASNRTEGVVMPDKFYDRLQKKNIKVKVLIPETSEAGELLTKGKGMPAGGYAFSPDISVYDNKVVIVSATDKLAVVVENQELANALKKAFDLSYQEAQRAGKKLSFGMGAA